MASVSVIVPTYERVDLLREALRSALAQTYEDFVVLVGDNSESDRAENVVCEFDDPRIRYHRNRPGLGGQGNWLDLVARAETPLVASLHDDDVWHRDFLAETVPQMLAEPDIAMTFTDFWMIDGDGTRLDDYTNAECLRTHRSAMPRGRYDYTRAEGLRLVAVWNAPQPAYAAVLRRDPILAIDFPDDISPLYDIWISYRLVMQNLGLFYVPRRLTNYRIHRGAVTSSGFARAEDAVFGRIIEENADAGPVADEIKAYLASLQWSRATQLMANGRLSRAASQHQMREAVDHLEGPKRAAALVGGHVGPAWHALRFARDLRHRVGEGPDARDVVSS
ncbi:MAG: glycosyltransferase [Actinomycetota bacterium]